MDPKTKQDQNSEGDTHDSWDAPVQMEHIQESEDGEGVVTPNGDQ